jgi:uncharacterized membrane protein YfcA
MLVVAALSAGSAGRFATAGALPRRPTLMLAITAVPGSVLGALSAVAMSEGTLRVVISFAMLAMAALLTFRPSLGQERVRVSRRFSFLGSAKPEFIRRLFGTVVAAIGIKVGYDRLNHGYRGQ